MPIDCIRPQYLSSFARFLITAGPDDTKLLHTNDSQALLMYTFDQSVVTLWSRELQMAIVYGLAAHICMPLTGKPSRTQMLVDRANRSEEHTSELQSLMRISYAALCLKQKKTKLKTLINNTET